MNGVGGRVNTSTHRRAHGPHTVVVGVLGALVVAVFVLTFLAQPIRIPSASMQPALMVGDFVMIDKQAYARNVLHWASPAEVQRGDLIVFHHPRRKQRDVVKRVVGLPGDHLRLANGRVLIGGQPLAEPYAQYLPAASDIFRDDFPALHSTDPEIDPQWWGEMRRNVQNGELVVPPGSYFVLGDNRNDSLDSRYWGFVPRNAIEGRAAVVYFAAASPEASSGWTRLMYGFRHAHVAR